MNPFRSYPFASHPFRSYPLYGVLAEATVPSAAPPAAVETPAAPRRSVRSGAGGGGSTFFREPYVVPRFIDVPVPVIVPVEIPIFVQMPEFSFEFDPLLDRPATPWRPAPEPAIPVHVDEDFIAPGFGPSPAGREETGAETREEEPQIIDGAPARDPWRVLLLLAGFLSGAAALVWILFGALP